MTADTNPLREARMRRGRALYLSVYESQGAIWEANDCKELWCEKADRYAALASEPVAGTVSVTDAMLDAHMRATGDWCEPFTAERESGVAIACDISQEDADGFNAEARAILRKGYAAGLALSPQAGATTASAPDRSAEFVMWALMNGSWQGTDIDGGAAQDKAVELGLIVETAYDPEKHGQNGDPEPGDAWFVPSDTLVAALEKPTTPAPGAADRAEWQPIETAPKDQEVEVRGLWKLRGDGVVFTHWRAPANTGETGKPAFNLGKFMDEGDDGAMSQPFTEEQLLAGARAVFAADIGMPDWNSPHFKGFREDCFRYTRLVLEAAALSRADGGAK